MCVVGKATGLPGCIKSGKFNNLSKQEVGWSMCNLKTLEDVAASEYNSTLMKGSVHIAQKILVSTR